MAGRGRVGRRAAAVVAPLVLSGLAVAGDARPAAAATGDETNQFTFTSDVTLDDVTCAIRGSFNSTPRSGGGWNLTASIRIAAASSQECFDGAAHLEAHHASGPPEVFDGGGSFVQVSTTTATEVTSIAYELYFNPCSCYTPVYIAPK